MQKAAKYDSTEDSKARAWLEEVTGEPFPTGLDPKSDTFHEALKDGVYLCKAINALQPGSVPKINNSKMAFKMVRALLVNGVRSCVCSAKLIIIQIQIQMIGLGCPMVLVTFIFVL